MSREPLLGKDDLVESPSDLKLTELGSEKKFENFLCPITQEIMKNPYSTKYGHSYEKNAILRWLSKSHTDPVTNQPLQVNEIFPNFSLKAEIESQLKEHGLDHLLKKQIKPEQTPDSTQAEISIPVVLEVPYVVPYTPPQPAPVRERMVERTYRESHPNCCVENVQELGNNYFGLINFFIRGQANDIHCSDGGECENTFACMCACLLSGVGSVVGCPVVAPIYCCTTMFEPCCPERVVTRTEMVRERIIEPTA